LARALAGAASASASSAVTAATVNRECLRIVGLAVRCTDGC
jgi:hypothetical protein